MLAQLSGYGLRNWSTRHIPEISLLETGSVRSRRNEHSNWRLKSCDTGTQSS